jgi:hypothetical protein
MERDLELLIYRHSRIDARVKAHGDPEDIRWLEGRLKGWLEGNRRPRQTWAQYEIGARPASGGRVLTTARAV